jgi:hypothetical protein
MGKILKHERRKQTKKSENSMWNPIRKDHLEYLGVNE